MGLSRSILLWCSQNNWMRKNVPDYSFVKRAAKRFMPGERLDDALSAARIFQEEKINAVLTYLGENISNLEEAQKVVEHYEEVINNINSEKLNAEISLKLTHIGLDYSEDQTEENLRSLVSKAKEQHTFVWVDMEQSYYVDRTINIFKAVRSEFQNVGLCLQAYLFRTKDDVNNLLEFNPHIRLVKGAYMEPSKVAFKNKKDVDANFIDLIKLMISESVKNNNRIAIATHDLNLINEIKLFALSQNLQKNKLEFHMLYGIKSGEQKTLVREGYKTFVLISYGVQWFPWYLRRLAERPANIGFVLKNIFSQ